MFDKLLESYKNEFLEKVTGETELDQDQTEKALPLAAESVQKGIQKEAEDGGLDGLVNMFQSGNFSQSSIFNLISGDFVEKITDKLGISSSVAEDVASKLLPTILGKAQNEASDDDGNFSLSNLNDMLDFDLGDMLGSLKDKFGGLGKLF